ncbi:nicotinamide mononucleotide transporter [bacterium]|nr:nicotinamide mononucleotide transporter [bacterium]
MVCSIASCIFAAQKMILTFPIGIIGSIFMIPVYYIQDLIGLMIMHIFNCFMQIIL